MADEIKYEYKTVRAVRGTDALMISRMQKDGRELLERSQGTLRSTLHFRRPKKPLPWRLIGVAASVAVVVTIAIGAALEDESVNEDEPVKSVAAAGEKRSAAPAPATTESAAATMITAHRDPDFAALLKADSCDDANAKFAGEHQGQIISFDGSIVNVAHFGDYDTRYDLLLGPGDQGPKTTTGPAFKYENVNLPDLHLTGKQAPATISEGDKFRFVAKVGEFNTSQCLFFLDPVSTEVR
jgi:hypothetical protein